MDTGRVIVAAVGAVVILFGVFFAAEGLAVWAQSTNPCQVPNPPPSCASQTSTTSTSTSTTVTVSNPWGTTTSTAVISSTTTVYVPQQFTLTVSTLSSSGTNVGGGITIDGVPSGSGTATASLTPFQNHVVTFGAVSGYTTPSPITVYLDTFRAINGVYFPTSASTTTLVVSFTNYGTPVPNRAVTAAAGSATQTQYTGACPGSTCGQAVFTVNQNTNYLVTLVTTGQSTTVSVGTSPASYTFALQLNGPFSYFALIFGFPVPGLSEAGLGIVMIFGGIGLIAVAKEGNP